MPAKPVLALAATIPGEIAVTVLAVRSPQPATNAVSNHVITQMRDLKILCGLFMGTPLRKISQNLVLMVSCLLLTGINMTFHSNTLASLSYIRRIFITRKQWAGFR